MSLDVWRRARNPLLVAILALTASSLAAHDLFLKLTTYFLPTDTPVRVLVLNGTFTKSEGTVARDRIADLALVAPSGRQSLDTTAIAARHDTSDLHLRTAGEGTYVLGLSVRPRELRAYPVSARASAGAAGPRRSPAATGRRRAARA